LLVLGVGAVVGAGIMVLTGVAAKETAGYVNLTSTLTGVRSVTEGVFAKL